MKSKFNLIVRYWTCLHVPLDYSVVINRFLFTITYAKPVDHCHRLVLVPHYIFGVVESPLEKFSSKRLELYIYPK